MGDTETDEQITVMVVDDHPMWRDAVARDLEGAGFTVVATADGVATAGRRAAATRPGWRRRSLWRKSSCGASANHARRAFNHPS